MPRRLCTRHPAHLTGVFVRVLLDQRQLHANVRWYHDAVRAHGLTLRAHVKGHRLAQVTSHQLASGACGIVAQTAREAVHHATETGVRDVVIARPSTEQWRLPVYAAAARALDARGVRTTVQVTSRDAVAVLAAEAARAGVRLGVRLEVDVGADRGLPATEVPGAAREIASSAALRLDGVSGYYSPVDSFAATRWAHGARSAARVLVEVAGHVRNAGIRCPVVSMGGTVNGLVASGVPGVTEIAAGAYALADATVAAATGCAPALLVEGGVVDGDLEEAAADLLRACGNDWDHETTATTPELVPVRQRLSRETATVQLVPAHICPVLMRARFVDVVTHEGREPTSRWRPVLLPEVEP
ncbi:alanine racemase [Cellulomonas triticagri]|uniref:alanine racemase n=1 Tax=Cellulomonas triticagri TaxID=2483352 RepID=UPI0034E26B92